MENYQNTIQIVAFSTNTDSTQIASPYEIIKMYLKYHDHILLKKKDGLAIAFKTTLPNSSVTTKIMICSALDLSREYNGIKDVNCYLLFVDLENKDSKNQLNLIIEYFLKNCNLLKKIYIIGIYSSYVENFKKSIEENQIKEIMSEAKINKYNYKELDVEDNNKISDTIMEILVASENIPNKRKKNLGTNEKQCNIY
jgi:hypothetical protein